MLVEVLVTANSSLGGGNLRGSKRGIAYSHSWARNWQCSCPVPAWEVLPDTLVVVEVKSCVFSHMSAEDAFQFKMPLDVCTQDGSVGCIMKDMAGPLSFTFACLSRKEEVAEVTTNVSDCLYDQTSCRASFSTTCDDLSAIIVTVKLSHILADQSLSAGKYLSLSVTELRWTCAGRGDVRGELICVVDCIGSMSGQRINSA